MKKWHNQIRLSIGVVGREEGSANVARAGTQALTLLAVPFHVLALRELAGGPRPLADLRRAVGSPPQTTMRCHLRRLDDDGVIRRLREQGFPGVVSYELSESGHHLLKVAAILERWLSDAPDGAAALGTSTAKSMIKALVEGWDTSMIRALAARPLTLTALDSLISGVSYPSLERRLGAMRQAGQVAPQPGRGQGTPYTVTTWLRRAIAPLGAGIGWERKLAAEVAPPITKLDVEAALLLSIPLLRLPDHLTGSCRLAVELHTDSGLAVGGARIAIDRGEIRACTTRTEGMSDAWISGSVSKWLRAVRKGDIRLLEFGGDAQLAAALVEGLHHELGRRPQGGRPQSDVLLT